MSLLLWIGVTTLQDAANLYLPLLGFTTLIFSFCGFSLAFLLHLHVGMLNPSYSACGPQQPSVCAWQEAP